MSAGKAFFLQRLNDHVQYLKKIQATLDGSGDFKGSDYHDCKLGHWLYGEGPDEATSLGPEARALFDSLFEPHQRFHDASHDALRMHAANDETGTRAAVTEMHRLSSVLVSKLLSLDRMAH